MEKDDSGLTLARFIRNDMKNHYSRIILRTGQPGFAPEYSVIRDYDIDAYKSKTELKRSDLESVFYTSLRSYRDITFLQIQRKCIEQVVDSITNINSATDLPNFASALLNQIQHFVGIENGQLILEPSEAFAISKSEQKTRILASSESLKMKEQNDLNLIGGEMQKYINESLATQKDVSRAPYFIHYMETQRKNEIVLALKSRFKLSDSDEELLKLFSSNVILIYENLILNEEINDSHNLLIRLLGGTVESRSLETGSHVRRVGEISALLSQLSGMSSGEIERMRMAAPLHDMGKISTPDSILNKPGKLTEDEWTIIRRHSEDGFDLMNNTDNPILDKASIIALEHHERWDGTGYPMGKKMKEITLEGRIVALADVFDALTSKRCYKDAWTFEKTLKFIEENSGTQFDPTLTELFLQHKEDVRQIYLNFPD